MHTEDNGRWIARVQLSAPPKPLDFLRLLRFVPIVLGMRVVGYFVPHAPK
jgi:hypothetical protein